MRLRHALVPAAVPVVALIAALPFVNRLEPVLLGLPFLLFWILGWVLATPALLALAYFIAGRADEGDADGAGGDPR
jgi:hypothetical protein